MNDNEKRAHDLAVAMTSAKFMRAGENHGNNPSNPAVRAMSMNAISTFTAHEVYQKLYDDALEYLNKVSEEK